ncbi:hypothetical protein [Oceanobacillus sp. E9]|uniref:hypothetical protein n=1 Tax=Oceanobacillus sp. E9 TaxID=1742575 RepID=UPI001112ED46|nr:hypothetical protein [Oceanobacillus sp. E9]
MKNLLKRYPHVSEKQFNHLLAKHQDNITNECGIATYWNIGKDSYVYNLPETIELELGDDLKLLHRTKHKELANSFAVEVEEYIKEVKYMKCKSCGANMLLFLKPNYCPKCGRNLKSESKNVPKFTIPKLDIGGIIPSVTHEWLNAGEKIHCYADGKLVATAVEPTPLLTITVQDKDSIPEITYRGKNYTKLKELNIQWDTMTDKDLGGLSVLIDHFDEDNNVHSCISEKYRGHLFND